MKRKYSLKLIPFIFIFGLTISSTGWTQDANLVAEQAGELFVLSNSLSNSYSNSGTQRWESRPYELAGYDQFNVSLDVEGNGPLNNSSNSKDYIEINVLLNNKLVATEYFEGNIGTQHLALQIIGAGTLLIRATGNTQASDAYYTLNNLNVTGLAPREQSFTAQAIPPTNSFPINTNYTGEGGFIVADVDSDGDRDIIVTQPGRILAYDVSGLKLWQVDDNIHIPPTSGAEVYGQPGHNGPGVFASDVDNDGTLEVLYVDFDNNLLAINGKTGLIESTIILPPVASYNNTWSTALIANFRGQGNIDILLGADINIRNATNPYLRTTKISAYTYSELVNQGTNARALWTFNDYISQSHGQPLVADLDLDGRDEVVGGNIISHDGVELYRIDIGNSAAPHIDNIVVADVDQGRPGLEVVAPRERPYTNSYIYLYNKQGLIWKKQRIGTEPDKLQVGDYDPSIPGLEIWSRGAESNDMQVWDKNGNVLANYDFDSTVNASWWADSGLETYSRCRWTGGDKEYMAVRERHDGGVDGARDVGIIDPLTANFIISWDNESAESQMCVDIKGDWREEMIVLRKDRLVIYQNNDVNPNPNHPSLWTDPYYVKSHQMYNYYNGVGGGDLAVGYQLGTPMPAENAIIVGAAIETEHTGYRGTGFVNINTNSGYIEWRNVDGGSGGSATLSFRYALGAAAPRTGALIVSGVTQPITMQSTGAWTNWATMDVPVNLTSGTNNTIRLQANGQDLGNTDEMTVNTNSAPPDDQVVGGGAVIESNHAGFLGTGFVNFNANDGYIEWRNINGESGGTATLTFRYALGAAARTGALIVNGVTQPITMQGTGAWTNWVTIDVPVSLVAGTNNTIRLQANGQDLGNVDELTVSVGATTGDIVSSASYHSKSAGWNADFFKLHDGDRQAEIYNTQTEAWVEYRFGPTTLTNCRIYIDAGPGSTIGQWKVSYYDGTWQDAFAYANTSGSGWKSRNFPDRNNVTQLRIYLTPPAGKAIGIYEFSCND